MRYFLDFNQTLFDMEGALKTPGELAPFVYKDVPDTLYTLGNDATIITALHAAASIKVEEALKGIPRLSVLYTEGMPKGEFLAARKYLWSGEAIFVDDRSAELENMAKHCPDVRLFEMRRNGEAGDGRWQVIRSLAELP